MSTALKKSQMSGAEVLVKTLEARGTKYVFGIPGAKIDAVFDTLADSTIQTVVCRHEQNAAFIAGGIGRMTGKAGVAIATSGPGVSNLVTGLATANSEGDPLVARQTPAGAGTRAQPARRRRAKACRRSVQRGSLSALATSGAFIRANGMSVVTSSERGMVATFASGMERPTSGGRGSSPGHTIRDASLRRMV